MGNVFFLACLIIFYQAGRMEGSRRKATLWAFLSFVIWFGLAYFFEAGFPIQLLGQGALFVGIGIIRATSE